LEIKTIILEEPTNKFKNGHEKFLPCQSLNFMVLGYPSYKSQNNRNPYTSKIFMAIFQFVGQFFFQNDVF
jgi:hypothetical protein